MHFVDRLFAAIRRVGNPVLVGIDPRPEELPPGFLERLSSRDHDGVSNALVSLRWPRGAIDVVAPLGCRRQISVRVLRGLWARGRCRA